MANTEVLPSTLLQVSPSACENCVGLNKIGQKPSVDGNFLTHFNSSLKQPAELDGGELLPVSGNILPQTFLSSSYLPNEPDLQPLASNHSENELTTNALNEQLAKFFDFESIQEQVTSIPVAFTHGINDLNTSQYSVNAQPDPSGELSDRLNGLLTAIDQSSLTKSAEISQTTFTANVQQPTLPGTLYEQSRSLQGEAFDTEELARDLQTFQVKQQTIAIESNSNQLDDFVKKYGLEQLIDDTSRIRLRNQTQPVELETFQQTFSASKPDAVLQNTNPVSILESGLTINTGYTQNSTIDAPIPLILKQISQGNFDSTNQSNDQSIFQNIKWLIGNKIQNANITVYPESLGQVNVSLNLEDSKLTINFLANSTVTKEVIEASLPNLRGHLTESGINLQEVNVNSRFSNHTENQSQNSENENKNSSNQHSEFSSIGDENEALHTNNNTNVLSSIYLIDAYV